MTQYTATPDPIAAAAKLNTAVLTAGARTDVREQEVHAFPFLGRTGQVGLTQAACETHTSRASGP